MFGSRESIVYCGMRSLDTLAAATVATKCGHPIDVRLEKKTKKGAFRPWTSEDNRLIGKHTRLRVRAYISLRRKCMLSLLENIDVLLRPHGSVYKKHKS